jgi:hypothetical protein
MCVPSRGGKLPLIFLVPEQNGAGAMKKTLLDGWKSLLRLLRFVFWYGFAVAVLLYLLPCSSSTTRRSAARSSFSRCWACSP